MAGRKLALISAIIAAVIIGGGIYTFTRPPLAPQLSEPTAHEYYWGDGCEYCARVNDFMATWDKKDTANIDKKEVWNNRANYNMMLSRAKACNLDSNSLGVPFLYTRDGQCLVGDQPIIEFFKSL